MKHQETAPQAYRRDRSTVKGRLRILASTLCIGACVALGTVSTSAQSPTPFGVPVGLENPGTNLNGKTVRGTRLFGWGDQGRSEVVARHGMVATSHHLAAQAGLEILEMGGNAADAAVAAASILDVTSQNDTGLGGDLFVLYWSARDKKLYALNAAGWSPAGWTPEYFATRQLSGVNSITVPGAVAGFDALLKRFGTMTFKQTFERARQLSEEGFGITERIHRDWAADGERAQERPRLAIAAAGQRQRSAALQHLQESEPRQGVPRAPARAGGMRFTRGRSRTPSSTRFNPSAE